MPLTKEERINIILLTGSGSTRHIANTFDATHRTKITHDTVAKPFTKFKRTVSVADASRSGRPKTATDEVTSTQVLTDSVGQGSDVSLRKWESAKAMS
ncbi:hypothetical protein AVEN_223721-1 [Araneus ventricosus]|uniref:DUF4817 domain-containing protein n=1 Tax=Araneus ventricosus TaxID=182803 RepID=A0A4Y2UCA1_ARAVE|nr:hypothetical protein AVEN_223721-1 [Araneus ventricosus]